MDAPGCTVYRPDAELQWQRAQWDWSWWECALPADEEGNYRGVIRSVRQDAPDPRRWPVSCRLSLIPTGCYFKPRSFFISRDSVRASEWCAVLRKKKKKSGDPFLRTDRQNRQNRQTSHTRESDSLRTFCGGGSFAHLLSIEPGTDGGGRRDGRTSCSRARAPAQFHGSTSTLPQLACCACFRAGQWFRRCYLFWCPHGRISVRIFSVHEDFPSTLYHIYIYIFFFLTPVDLFPSTVFTPPPPPSPPLVCL